MKKKKWRIKKSKSNKSSIDSEPFYGLTVKNIQDIILLIGVSYQSENGSDHVDPNEDYQHALGIAGAVHSAKRFNKKLDKLMDACQKELKRVAANPPHNPQDDVELSAYDAFDNHYL